MIWETKWSFSNFSFWKCGFVLCFVFVWQELLSPDKEGLPYSRSLYSELVLESGAILLRHRVTAPFLMAAYPHWSIVGNRILLVSSGSHHSDDQVVATLHRFCRGNVYSLILLMLCLFLAVWWSLEPWVRLLFFSIVCVVYKVCVSRWLPHLPQTKSPYGHQ